MLLVALTGGLGAGKSTVAGILEAAGAVTLDADDLARRAVAPGSPGLARLVDAFGPDILDADGGLDRAEMARRAFADDDARRQLEAVVHPEVARLFAEEVDALRGGDDIVVYSVPLLVERGLADAFDVVVTVSAPLEARLARVAASGRMTQEDARARAAAQATDADREAVADVVVPNDGDLEQLSREAGRVWDELRMRARARSR
jgi:dephospho-CoA kinase